MLTGSGTSGVCERALQPLSSLLGRTADVGTAALWTSTRVSPAPMSALGASVLASAVVEPASAPGTRTGVPQGASPISPLLSASAGHLVAHTDPAPRHESALSMR